MPPALVDLWRTLSGAPADPDCCLVNLYGPDARMGLHQDRDEADFSFPVLSVSLGDAAVFRIGAATRGGRTQTVRLASGDICLLGGAARLAFHGIDRIVAGSSRLIPDGGRLNLTLRRAGPWTAPDSNAVQAIPPGQGLG
jgi:alkylated DNA repair protein (DNA oxidative demethylase)